MKKLNKKKVKEYMGLRTKYCKWIVGWGKMSKRKVKRFLKLENVYFKFNLK